MNFIEENLVRTIAAEEVSVKGNAEAILAMVYNEFRIPETPELGAGNNTMVTKKSAGIDNNDVISTQVEKSIVVNSYPNPVENTLTVEYSIPGNYTNVRIVMTDIYGRTLMDIPITAGSSIEHVSCLGLAKGMYLYACHSDQGLLDSGKIFKQ